MQTAASFENVHEIFRLYRFAHGNKPGSCGVETVSGAELLRMIEQDRWIWQIISAVLRLEERCGF